MFKKELIDQIKMREKFNNECKHHAMDTIKQLNYRIANY